MSGGDALEPDMRRFALDSGTAERLVRGAVAPADAPPGYGEVASLLQDAGAPRTTGPHADKAATVAAVAEAVRSHPPTSAAPRRSVFTKAKLAAAGLAGALTLTTGLAAANALPGAAQSAASDALAEVGVSVPNPNSHSAGHANNRGKSVNHNTSSPGSANSTSGPNAHADFGLCTAAEAHQDNGAQPKSSVFPSATTCSTVVHPGQGTQADDHGKPANPGSQGQANKPSSTPAGPPSSTPAVGTAPVNTPNGGGRSTADTASDGHSSAGSDNAGSHRP